MASSSRSEPPSIPAATTLKNRERTNRLLLLMQRHANRQDDVLAYAKDIRVWLEANHGRPRVPAALSPTDAAAPRCVGLSQSAPGKRRGRL